MNKFHLPSALCAAAVVFASSVSNAALVAYTDQAAFLAALPGPASTLDFDSVAAGTLLPSGSAVGGITFTYNFGSTSMAVTDGNQFGGGGPFDTTSGSNFLGTDSSDLFLDDDDFSMSFATSNAIGLSIVTGELTSGPFQSLFNDDIQLTAGGMTALLDVAALQSTLADGSLVFFLGLIDDSASFTTASLSTPNSSQSFLYNIDDITTSVVPLPGALGLFGSGLAGLLAVRRRRQATRVIRH